MIKGSGIRTWGSRAKIKGPWGHDEGLFGQEMLLWSRLGPPGLRLGALRPKFGSLGSEFAALRPRLGLWGQDQGLWAKIRASAAKIRDFGYGLHQITKYLAIWFF